MSSGLLHASDEPTLSVVDGLVAAWVVLWLVIGGWFCWSTWQLADLGDTVTTSGSAIESAGKALQSLDAVPVVGEKPARLGVEVAATGSDVAARGQDVKAQLRQTAVLMGLAIAMMPTTPILGLYVPLRLARRREADAVRRALAGSDGDAALDRLLADRALRSLPIDRVRAIWDTHQEDGPPARAWERALADAELERLGVQRIRR